MGSDLDLVWQLKGSAVDCEENEKGLRGGVSSCEDVGGQVGGGEGVRGWAATRI